MTHTDADAHTALTKRSIDRRTIVKGAAWSVPVIATTVGVPLASASTDSWNVSIMPSCVVNVGGVGQLVPGFKVVADPTDETIPSTLAVTETASGTWSITLPAPNTGLFGTIDPTKVPGFDIAYGAFSLAYASAVVAAVLVPAALSFTGEKVNADFWITPQSVGDYFSPPTVKREYSGSGLDQVVTLSVTWDLKRNVRLNGLESGFETSWGYPGAIVPPDVRDVPGYDALNGLVGLMANLPIIGSSIRSAWNTAIGSLSPQLSLTAVGGWNDAKDDQAATLSNVFSFGC